MKKLLLLNSTWAKDTGLLIIRVALGLIFVRHGYGKLMGGPEQWLWLGNQMATIGITFFPVFWGLCSALAEFFGGLALVFGVGTRIACLFLIFNMSIALLYHLYIGDTFMIASHPLSLLFVFIGIFIAGAGRFSVDQRYFSSDSQVAYFWEDDVL